MYYMAGSIVRNQKVKRFKGSVLISVDKIVEHVLYGPCWNGDVVFGGGSFDKLFPVKDVRPCDNLELKRYTVDGVWWGGELMKFDAENFAK